MLYHSLWYLPFLAACLAAYWLVARSSAARMTFLAAASVGFLVVAETDHLLPRRATADILGAALLAIVVYHVASSLRRRSGPLRVLLALAIPLAVLGYFKYLNVWFPGLLTTRTLLVPMGVSYYTFKHVHYLIESARGRIKDASLRDYLGYIFFFPMFSSGPIERFTNFAPQAGGAAWDWRDASGAVERIVIGMAKKYLIADVVLAAMFPAGDLLQNGAPHLGWHQVLFACFARLLLTYFDFSGYTDMALGTARLFGFRLMENFDFPLLRADLAEFWRTWHISLTSWARDYVYFPLLGWTRSTDLAVLGTMFVIGAWHGAQPGWLLWGVHHGIGLAFLPHYRRWCERRPLVQRVRSTLAWRVAATLGVWGFVSAGLALTLDPGTVASSVRLYLKILTLGGAA